MEFYKNMEYGKGKFSYELIEGWAKLPEGWSFRDVPGLAIDSEDRVYVFSRGNHPVTVFDREGNLLTSWASDCNHGASHRFIGNNQIPFPIQDLQENFNE